MSATLEQLMVLIKEKGYRLTTQRRYILDAIMENHSEHLSIEELYTEVKKRCPEIGIATIYRTVQILEETGVLAKQNFADGCSRYELVDQSERHNHHHLVCIKCGKVIEIKDDYFDKLEQHIEKDENFVIINHNVTFYGKCKECMND